jgi:hypothetical protein
VWCCIAHRQQLLLLQADALVLRFGKHYDRGKIGWCAGVSRRFEQFKFVCTGAPAVRDDYEQQHGSIFELQLSLVIDVQPDSLEFDDVQYVKQRGSCAISRTDNNPYHDHKLVYEFFLKR